jgi:1-acyl-sn-glycerol-3-phosphate acyltransferase
MISSPRAVARLLLLGAWTVLLAPPQIVALLLRLRLAERIPVLYHRVFCRVIGLDVVKRGTVSKDRPTLFVGNHISYLDITVLGSLLPASFITKAEVASWPLFGILAKMQRSVFVERRALFAAQHRDIVKRRLEARDNLVLFPEGTSNDGCRVLPFKSALFSVAEGEIGGKPLTVQPLSIAYLGPEGRPAGREWRRQYAYFGDDVLVPHLWHVLGLGRATVEIRFHPAVAVQSMASRKALSDFCYEVVAAGLADSLGAKGDGSAVGAAGP